MKVAVAGANGGIGRHLVTQLLAAGHTVTAIVRRSSGSEPLNSALAVATLPDLQDRPSLASILRGHDAVLSGIGPRSLRDGPVASLATAAIIAAMHSAEVSRLVTVSAAPVGGTPPGEGWLGRFLMYPLIGTLLRALYDDLAEMEAAMRQSGHDCTAIRPPRLTNGALSGQYRRRIGGSVPNGFWISRADAAHAMIGAITEAETFGQPLGVAK